MKKYLFLTPLFLLLTGCPWDSKDSNEPVLLAVETIHTDPESETTSTAETDGTIPQGNPSGNPSESTSESTSPSRPGTETSNSGSSDENDDVGQAPSGDMGNGSEAPQAPSQGTPTVPTETSWQEDMLTLINTARGSGYVCGGSFYPAQAPLTLNFELELAAQRHADDMQQQNYYSHTSLDGRSAGTRISNAGYEWRAYGENIAAGQDTVEIVVQAWLDSAGHCVNIMSPNFKHAGFGHANGPSQWGDYWVQNFGNKR